MTPCRSGVSSDANCCLPSSLRTSEPKDRLQLLAELLLGPARMYISSGSTMR